MVQGAGVDCAHLAAALYIGTGLWSSFRPGEYRMDGGRALAVSHVEQYAREVGTFEEQSPLGYTPMPGDLLAFDCGRVTHHVGVLIEDTRFMHVYLRGKAEFGDIADATWATRLRTVFVPIEEVQ